MDKRSKKNRKAFLLKAKNKKRRMKLISTGTSTVVEKDRLIESFRPSSMGLIELLAKMDVEKKYDHLELIVDGASLD